MSDLANVFQVVTRYATFLWMLVALLFGVALLVGRFIAGLTTGVLVALRDSSLALGIREPGPVSDLLSLKIHAMAGEEIDESAISRAAHVTELDEPSRAETEAFAEIVGTWVTKEFARIATKDRRRRFYNRAVDLLTDMRKR